MKASQWRAYLEEQRRTFGKRLFTVTELAHAAGVGRNALNVELSRLLRQGVAVRYAHGLYGLPGEVTAEELLRAIDGHAYITGMYALHLHHMIAQVPVAISCFIDRRIARARVRATPVGRFAFHSVAGRVYDPPADGIIAGPAQALCDFVYLCRRAGVDTAAQAAFRNLHELSAAQVFARAKRYPATVGAEVRGLMGVDG